MAKTANRFYSRAEIRNILTELSNDQGQLLVMHRDAFRPDTSHVEETCKICLHYAGEIEGLRFAVRHFGVRNG